MAKWIDVAGEQDVPPGHKRCVDVQGAAIVLCNVAGKLHATSNVCPHAGMPIGDGDLAGDVLTCPYHGYAFSVATGKNIDDPDMALLTTYPVRCANGRIEVEL